MAATVEFWYLQVFDPDEGACLAWFSDKPAAEAGMAAAIANGSDASSCSIHRCSFPWSKEGLLGWLNRRYTRDNG